MEGKLFIQTFSPNGLILHMHSIRPYENDLLLYVKLIVTKKREGVKIFSNKNRMKMNDKTKLSF